MCEMACLKSRGNSTDCQVAAQTIKPHFFTLAEALDGINEQQVRDIFGRFYAKATIPNPRSHTAHHFTQMGVHHCTICRIRHCFELRNGDLSRKSQPDKVKVMQ